MLGYINGVIRKRELLWFLAVLDIKARQRVTALGLLWSLLDPLLMMLVYLFVFSVIFKTRTPNFALHLLLALIPFKFTQSAILTSSQSLIRNKSLIDSAGFPRMVLPISTILSAFLQMLFAFVILIMIGPFLGMKIGISVVFIPVVLVFQILLTIGIGLLTSVANIRYQDISKLLPHVIRVWWYLSPGLYTLDQIPSTLLPLELLNPFAVIFPAYQNVLMNAGLPDFSTWWPSLIVTGVILITGVLVFIREDRTIAKYV